MVLAAHNIIFFMHYGFIPKRVVHFDRDPMNNRIENLHPEEQTEVHKGWESEPKPEGWGLIK